MVEQAGDTSDRQCEAILISTRQCPNRAVDGDAFCRLHQPPRDRSAWFAQAKTFGAFSLKAHQYWVLAKDVWEVIRPFVTGAAHAPERTAEYLRIQQALTDLRARADANPDNPAVTPLVHTLEELALDFDNLVREIKATEDSTEPVPA